VEISIVIIIIGLIIGGTLVGRDLIKAAEIRATTNDLERYNAAANTFRSRFGGLPGDLQANRAAKYGLVARSGASAHGDNNGVMEGCTPNSVYLGCETALFWRDLTNAQFIAGAYLEASDALVDAATISDINNYLPSVRLRDNAFLTLYPERGRNYYLLASYADITTGAQNFSLPGVQALSASEASQIDEKIDDGKPLTGIVSAVSGWNGGGNNGANFDAGAPAASGICVNQGANPATEGDESYNTANADFASELNCMLSIRASF
jgi:hypothetical protein